MKLPLVPLAAVTLGSVSAFIAAAAPAAVFDHLLAGSDGVGGLWSGLPDAARISRPLAVVASGAIGAGAAALVAHLLRPRIAAPAIARALEPEAVPIIRRADAHTDARPRAPLRARRELESPGWPAPEPAAPVAERPLPADLDQPLAAFDPQAIPAAPLPPPVRARRGQAASAPLRLPSGRESADRIVRPETDATVHALLERLERGVIRRDAAVQARGRARPDRGLDDALATLRNLARQA